MHEHTTLEGRLRRTAPPLRPADPARVDAALARIARGETRLPQPGGRAFVRTLARAAAGLVLLLGVAGILLRPQPRPTAGTTGMPPVTTFADLAGLMQEQALTHTLAGEAADLTDDLADLTDALNKSALEILF